MQIKRGITTVYDVDIDESTIYSSELMGMDKVVASFIHAFSLDVTIDDYIVHDSRKYSIKTATECKEINSNTYLHNITFYGEIYEMYNEMIMHLGRTKFDYTGTPLDLLSLIIDNLNAEIGGWSIGGCSSISDVKTFTFSEQSCRIALSEIAEQFELEYYVLNKQIFLIEQVGTVRDIQLEYGRGKGLYSSNRVAIDQPFATVWYVYGGNQNIPYTYRGGMDRLTLDSTIENNVSLYRRKKGSITFEDIYPRRTGVITAVTDFNNVIDDTLDFDLNESFIDESGAKIVFKTGELSGNEFVITAYNHLTKSIRFGTNKDETGYSLPNATFEPQVGDTYTITGIILPEAYIVAAEAELYEKGLSYVQKHSFPPVSFPLDIDEKYIRTNSLEYQLKPGDFIHVVAESLGVDTDLRLQSISYPLVNPAKYSGVVSDFIQYSTQDKIVRDIKRAKKEVASNSEKVNFAKNLTEEVKNAAILNQFKKTYVGDYCVLSGSFLIGNPEDGVVGGMLGTGDDTSLGFFLGADFEDRETAPLRLYRNGDAFANKLTLEDGCKIGLFEVQDDILYRRTSEDPFEVDTNYAQIGDYFLFRKNGGIEGDTKEVQFNLTGSGAQNHAFYVANSIPTEFGSNVGLYAFAKGATDLGDNIAVKAEATGGVLGVRNIAVQCLGDLDIQGNVYINGYNARNATYNVRLSDGSSLVMSFNEGVLI